MLLQAARGQDYHKEFEYVVDFYGSDFESSQLDTQLQNLSTHFKSCAKQSTISFKDVCDYLKSLSKAQQSFFSQVVVLVTLILVMPATNASSERSFSALRQIKTYLRSTMAQLRLNSLMVLHVHKELTDKLNILEVANEFVANKLEHRLNIFGKFTEKHHTACWYMPKFNLVDINLYLYTICLCIIGLLLEIIKNLLLRRKHVSCNPLRIKTCWCSS